MLLAAPGLSTGADIPISPNPVQVALASQLISIVKATTLPSSRVENTEEFSQSCVAQIAPDDRGFMWSRTAHGLDRFDGYGHTVFAGNSRAPGSAQRVCIVGDRQRQIGAFVDRQRSGGRTFSIPGPRMFRPVGLRECATAPGSIQSITAEDRSGTDWLSTSAGCTDGFE